jgi:hypothetical protein
MGVTMRRRFGIDRGQLTAYEDERLDCGDGVSTPETTFRSQILVGEIERPRAGPMRDIVATIQPEQDAIVRSDVDVTICVQGAPGTGKTAGRPAPGGVAALCVSGTPGSQRSAGRRSQPCVPGPHRSRASHPRRGGRPTLHDRRTARLSAGASPRQCGYRRPEGRPTPGGDPAQRRVVVPAHTH